MGEKGLSLHFQVTLDNQQSLGSWSKCEGLAIEYEVQEYMEGGENSFVHRLPGRAKYPNLKLTRIVDESSTEVVRWVAGMREKVVRQTAHITVLDSNGKVMGRWSLAGVCPVKWTGPSLDQGGNQVATEVLELAHNGFLPEA